MKLRKAIIWAFLAFMGLSFFLWFASKMDLLAGPNRIAVIRIRGVIDDVQEMLKAMKEYREDDNVQAIILRIESPGGGIGPSQELYREVKRTAAVKPVVASLGGVAASGGYYIASATDHIVANPGTITGSIGVVISFPNLRELFDRLGYHTIVIKSGEFKDTGNPGREMTPQERDLLEEAIQQSHLQFVRHVAEGRNMPQDAVMEVADGRILLGEKAFQLGLVDELGNFYDAVAVAARLGEIKEKPKVIFFEKRRRSLLDFLLGTDMSERVVTFLDGSHGFIRYQLPAPQ